MNHRLADSLPTSSMNTILRLTLLLLLPLNLLANEGIEFFEAKVRPVLVEHCYECHNSSGKAKAKLALDYKGGVLKGGSEGPAIAPGKPEESLLLKTIRHEFEDLRMPKNGPRLSKNVLEDFRKWIAMGAPDPRDKPPSAELREDQKDSDSLPDYPDLDAMLTILVDDDGSIADCVAAGFDREVAKKVEHLLYISEYKRFQSAPGPRLTKGAFWLDRRYPIVNRWRDPS